MLEMVWIEGNPPTLLVGMPLGVATVENSMEIPQKTKTEWVHDPVIPLMCICAEKTIIQKDIWPPAPSVHCSTIHSSQSMSIGGWMDKEHVVHIYHGTLLSHKTNNAMCSDMHAIRDYHIKYVRKKKQLTYDITYIWHLKLWFHEHTYETDSQTQKRYWWSYCIAQGPTI